jgi:CHAT domain-containing protein/Tfp pilus assembly protein PilF
MRRKEKMMQFCSRALAFALVALALTALLAPCRVEAQLRVRQHPTTEVQALLDAGKSLRDVSRDPKESRLRYEAALRLARDKKDKAGSASAELGIGNTYYDEDKYPDALTHYEAAGALASDAQEPYLQMKALTNQGSCHMLLGNTTEAVRTFGRAIEICRAAGDAVEQARVQVNLAGHYMNVGELEQAYSYALLASQALKDADPWKGMAIGLLGDYYRITGQRALSLHQYELALPYFRGDPVRQAEIQVGIGHLHLRLRAPEAAKAAFNKVLGIPATGLDRMVRARALLGLAEAHNVNGETSIAIDKYNQAIPEVESLKTPFLLAQLYNNLGGAYDDSGAYDEALAVFRKAHKLAIDVRDTTGAAQVLGNIAHLESRKGLNEDADRDYRRSLNVLDKGREQLGGAPEAQIGLMQYTMEIYHMYTDLLMRQKRYADAFAVMERSKARVLSNLLVSGKIEITESMSPAEKEGEKTRRQKLDDLNGKLLSLVNQDKTLDTPAGRELKSQIDRAEGEYEEYVQRLYGLHPQLASKRAAVTASAGEIAKLLPERSALLQCLILRSGRLTAASDRIALLLLTRDARGHYRLDPSFLSIEKTREVMQLIPNFREACADPTAQYEDAAHKLWTLLLGPFAAVLKSKSHLIICPDGELWDVPFQATMSGSKFLEETVQVSYAFSGTALRACVQARRSPVRSKPSKTLFAIGDADFGGAERLKAGSAPGNIDPSVLGNLTGTAAGEPNGTRRGPALVQLPGTKDEVDEVKTHFKQPLTLYGADAQERRFRADAGKCRIIHLATHGFYNDAAPLMSGVVLAKPDNKDDDGIVTARELYATRLSADLVVLSACETARGGERQGEGILGLSWSLFVAGVPAHLVSQWSVNDRSTVPFMKTFYTDLIDRHAGTSAALQHAATTLIGKRKHPYYWAPFVLIGDWH